MSVPASLARTALFAALYLAAMTVGRLTVLDGTAAAVVWPAAGVAVLWFFAQRRAVTRWADVVAFAAVTFAVDLATGMTSAAAAVLVAANLVQVAVLMWLLARGWPDLWHARGDRTLHSPRQLWGLLGAVLTATVCGAAVGPTGVALLSGGYSWTSTLAWIACNSAGMLLIGAFGLCLGNTVSAARVRYGTLRSWWPAAVIDLAGASRWRIAEYLGLAVSSVVAYYVCFAVETTLPIAFPLLVVTVWAATRVPTPWVVVQGLLIGAIVVVFTLHGDGPFGGIADHTARAFLCQLFVATVAVIGLAVALGRDERDALLAELATEKARMAVEREQAKQHADLMSAIIDAMGDGLAVVDANGFVVLRNPIAAQLLGVPACDGERIAGAAQYGLHHLDGTPMSDAEMPYTRAMAGEHIENLDLIVRNPGVPDGRIVSVTATTVARAAGEVAVIVFHDVTAERRHRDELAGFAGVVAHDLLNPLTTVEGWSDTVAELLETDSPRVGMARDGIERVIRAAGRMRGLINDLLAYATSRDGGIAPVPVNLAEMVGDIIAARCDAAVAAGAPVPEFTVGSLVPVHADRVLTRQLLDNLIANAVKYTAPGVVPRLTVHSETRDGLVAVVLTDNGIGIPAGQHDAIFGNFHRAHRDAGYAGTGLGLAICKRIVERHGGNITAGDNPGGGSRFTFTLPAGTAPAEAGTCHGAAVPA